MIVRVAFTPDHVMLFGDSYKSWDDQFLEYAFRSKDTLPLRPARVETSGSKWKSWGGLKWCPDHDFQAQLNREGCQAGEPDNPRPRQYAEMKFAINDRAYGKVRQILAQVKEVA